MESSIIAIVDNDIRVARGIFILYNIDMHISETNSHINNANYDILFSTSGIYLLLQSYI